MSTPSSPKRPEFRNIAISDITSYRLPIPGIVSILHRVSGVLMFIFLPFMVWLMDHAVTSQESFARAAALFGGGMGWFYKLLILALVWALLHHMLTGIRFLIMDVCHDKVSKPWGRASAKVSLVAALVLTVVLGAKLFGLY